MVAIEVICPLCSTITVDMELGRIDNVELYGGVFEGGVFETRLNATHPLA